VAVIISWAKRTSDVEAVFLHGDRAKGTAVPDSGVDLALSIIGDGRCGGSKRHRPPSRLEGGT
jgi:hypothetical protein